MTKAFYRAVCNYPKVVLLVVIVVTVVMALQLPSLRWETDARVYMPKGHPAIKYDEKIESVFGVKDAIIVSISNENSIYNYETLQRVKVLSEKIAALPSVVANRTLDVTSLSTATVFVGTETDMGAEKVMSHVPATPVDIANLKSTIQEHADLLVGNIVSEDGLTTVIRAKVKEGATNRYQAYWQIKGILDSETGAASDWGGGDWQQQDWSDEGGGDWQGWQQGAAGDAQQSNVTNGDTFLISGRPAIEVTSGLNALEDMKSMVPMLFVVLAVVLFAIFKTWRGVIVPILVMMGAIIWTLGAMVLVDVPLYTISTMLPVILVAVGVADSVHLLTRYYNQVLETPHAPAPEIVGRVLGELGPPLFTTSITTAIGFLALLFAEMPPFKVFGVFTVVGVMLSWLLTITFAAALLCVLKPKVGGYLKKRRSMRVSNEQDVLAATLVKGVEAVNRNIKAALVLLVAVCVVSVVGAQKLEINSSWLSDFKKESEIVKAAELLNERMAGSVMLNVVFDTGRQGGLKEPDVLAKMERMQAYAETLPFVGDTLSIVDYLKSMNKTLNSGDQRFDVLPATKAEVAEFLYLYSVSGQPELLDELVDYSYEQANMTVMIQTDETANLKHIIESLRVFADNEINRGDVEVNFAGGGNNAYIWAQLLIQSQGVAILFSKVAIFIFALIIFRALVPALMIVVPVSLATLIVAGGFGWLGIPLDVSTALAAGLAIGVGVDYAIHYTYRYIALRRKGQGNQDAVAHSLRGVGRTIVINAFVVAAGFSVLLLSQFPPHTKLGAFVVVYMFVSCLVALFLLPMFKLKKC